MFGEAKRSATGYTIAKEIIGTMIGVAPFALAFFVWMSSVQTRLAVLEESRTAQVYRDKSQDDAVAVAMVRSELAQSETKQAIRDLEKYLRDNTVRR
jgi:hypothetical protein